MSVTFVEIKDIKRNCLSIKINFLTRQDYCYNIIISVSTSYAVREMFSVLEKEYRYSVEIGINTAW